MPDKKATVITIGMSEEEFAKLEEKTRKMLQSADAEWQVTLLRCDTLADAAEKAFASMPRPRRKDVATVEETVRLAVRRAAEAAWGKKPVVKVIVVRV